jgi:hypothetical protein
VEETPHFFKKEIIQNRETKLDYLTIPSKFFSPSSHRPVLDHAEDGTGRKLFRQKSAVALFLFVFPTQISLEWIPQILRVPIV